MTFWNAANVGGTENGIASMLLDHSLYQYTFVCCLMGHNLSPCTLYTVFLQETLDLRWSFCMIELIYSRTIMYVK